MLLAFAAEGANYRQVFADHGAVEFIDADCYSRMTRVREVCAHPGEVLRRHEFENYPFGTRPHTTVPFDYAVWALRGVLWPFYRERALDLAGAWISPLLGLLTVLGVWAWAERERLPGRGFALLVLAASPIVAHGFALGRPDHQSLIMACMAAALAAEWVLWQRSSRGWGIVSGVAWAVGLWTSLYEPTILLAAVVVAGWVWNRAALRQRERLLGLAAGGASLLGALWIEGWRIDAIPGMGEGGGAEFFAAWSKQIGELTSLPPWSPTLFAWTGLGLLAAPVLLLWRREPQISADDSEGRGQNFPAPSPICVNLRPIPAFAGLPRAQVFLLLVVWALTCWQARWGYFLPLVYVLGVPWQFDAIPTKWRGALTALLVLLLWPMAGEWWTRLHPPADRAANLAEQRADAVQRREVARFIAQASRLPAADADPAAETDGPPAGILAPWWLSPALAYESGQPALAGSSHESLPGTVDVDRFYIAADAREAAAILRRRRVRWVVAYEPDRVLRTAAALLGQTQVSKRAMGFILYARPEMAPRFLRLALVNPFFKVYEVRSASLPTDP